LLPFLVINFAGTMTLPEDLSYRICWMLLGNVSAFLGVVSLFLFRREIVKDTRLFFLILAALFFLHGLLFGLLPLTKRWLFPLDEWTDFYIGQYRLQIYFLLLSGCVNYLVVHLSFRGLRTLQKYFLAFVVAGSVWGYMFYPYYANPKYLYTTSDVEDYRAIRAAKGDMERRGVTNPSAEQIASHLGEHLPQSARLGIHCSAEDRGLRVSEILPYFHGDDSKLLVLRPLWRSCIVMALFSIVTILIFILYQYLADPPKSAYMEKVLWCLLPFCCFEALHLYAYVQVSLFEDFRSVELLGIYASMGIMLALLSLLIVRLRFIQSIEGRFYESRLIEDAWRITRWRDAIDNWILRQFMNPTELEQRFLVQSKHNATKESTHDRP
jgi:hypothetical protein